MNVEKRAVSAHRIAYAIAYGPIPEGMQVDHICHNRACQKPEHLRLVTPKQNSENHNGPRRDSTSGVRGVSWHTQSKKWWAHVGHKGRMHSGGLYHSIEEAEAAVIELRKQLHTHNDKDRR